METLKALSLKGNVVFKKNLYLFLLKFSKFLAKIFHVYAKNFHVQMTRFMVGKMQEKIQEKINSRIEYLEDFYIESKKINNEDDIYDKYVSLRKAIKKDCLINYFYCNAITIDKEINSKINSIQEMLGKLLLYLEKSWNHKNNIEMPRKNICDKIEFLYLPSLSFYLNTELTFDIFQRYYNEENISFFSIIGLYYSIFYSLLNMPFEYSEDFGPYEESIKIGDVYSAAGDLCWRCKALFEELRKNNDGKIDVYLFDNMDEEIFQETTVLMPDAEEYNKAYLKSILLKTIKFLIASLKSYEKLEDEYKSTIENIRNNLDMKLEDLDEKLNRSSGKLQKNISDTCKELNIFYIDKKGVKSYGFKALKKYAICINQILQDCDT